MANPRVVGAPPSALRCIDCHHDNPGNRMQHWMNYPERNLEGHMREQFDENNLQCIHGNLRYIRNEKSRLEDGWRKHAQDDGSPMRFGDYYMFVYLRRDKNVSDIVSEMAAKITPEEAKRKLLKYGYSVDKRMEK